MRHRDEDLDDTEAGESPDRLEHDDDGDSTYEGDVEVTCPYCGEVVTISLDPGGGASQEYVEDCEVCCRPWQVYVNYGTGGSVEVRVEATA